MSNIRFLKTLFIVNLILSAIPLYADENDTSGLTMRIPSICKLEIKGSNQLINLIKDASGEEAYENGYIEGDDEKPKLIIDSNGSWKLSVRVITDWVTIGGYHKATEDLKLKIVSNAGHQTGFTDFTSLSTSEQEIASYSSGVSDDEYMGQYRILLDWEKDKPGVYVIIITYTLSTQT